MKRKKYIYFAIKTLFLFSATSSSASIPPPPVNQALGIPDSVFNLMSEAQCRSCHEGQSGTGQTYLAWRHHLLLGSSIPAVSEVQITSPGNCYECLSCHSLVTNPSTAAIELAVFRNCTSCHIQKQSQPTVHHKKQITADSDCKACHRLIDEMNDGHYIPTYAATESTPKPGKGTGPNGEGGCAFCHNTGFDTASRWQIYTNAITHHTTGIVLPPFMEIRAECEFCHKLFNANVTPIRLCQNCHGVNTLHKIQADSNGDGLITQGGESPWHGHIGSPSDCAGCHEAAIPPGPVPSESGPRPPELDSLSREIFTRGESATLTIGGSWFMDLALNADGTTNISRSDTMLFDRSGRRITLGPIDINENQLSVAIPPYLPDGSYTVRLTKGGLRSEIKNIIIMPTIAVFDVSCVAGDTYGRTIVTGKDFGEFIYGMGIPGSGIGVATDLGECLVETWTDTEITALCDINCGTSVEIHTALGSAAAPMGNALAVCVTCHGDNSGLVNCRNKKWKIHQREGMVSQAISDLAEIKYLGATCASAPNAYKDRTRK